MTLNILLLSDVHLEINHDLPVAINATSEDIVLVAGDTIPTRYLPANKTDARSRSFRKALINFLDSIVAAKHVYFVMGNHEHYSGDINQSKSNFQNFLNDNNYLNMTVLENDMVALNDQYNLAGCTLWTNFNNNPISHRIVAISMNDYKYIDNGDRLLWTQDTYNIHCKSVEFLANAYIESERQNRKLIIMTHHAPSFQSNGDRVDKSLIDGYCSDLEYFILNKTESIPLWVHGHVHENLEYKVRETRIITNCVGYGSMFHHDKSFDYFTAHGLRKITL